MNIFLCSCFMLTLCLSGAAFAHNSSDGQKAKVVILLGPPGSGKGTQAQRISNKLAIPHISTGDLFRENIAKGTDLGREAKSYIDAGQLTPDELVLRMLFDRLTRADTKQGYLLDGFPRTIIQAESLEKYFKDKNIQLFVVNLDVPDQVLIDRIAGRLKNSQDAAQQRNDDKPEVVKERLKVYHAQTAPLEDFYKQRNLLINIDGTKSPDEVYQAIINQVK